MGVGGFSLAVRGFLEGNQRMSLPITGSAELLELPCPLGLKFAPSPKIPCFPRARIVNFVTPSEGAKGLSPGFRSCLAPKAPGPKGLGNLAQAAVAALWRALV